MQTVRVYRLHPSAKLFALLKAAQKEAAHVWNLCMETHKQARMTRSKWPGRDALQKSTISVTLKRILSQMLYPIDYKKFY